MDESRFDLLPGLVKEFLAGAWDRGVRIERLPPYAPDLNPVEGAWQHLKLVEMRNLVCLDLEERTWRNFTWNSVSPSAA